MDTRVKTREELGESLGRFGLTHSQLDPQVLLARFRRRELLRIYLHDIRGTSTLVEITEELSNLADAVLEHALTLARQELDNRYGSPTKLDEKGRVTNADLCIVALGKLGSGELNYASDIDLLFLYSDDGQTSGKGTRGETTNREYFIKLAGAVARMVGEPTGEGAAYRVDLRLRPYGRDGALAASLDEAFKYYRNTAQPWERQALIRARAAAGDAPLFSRFAQGIHHSVYARDVTVTSALGNVRLAKQKIDRQHIRDSRGLNVKLGHGGIREIEFIAQALQLAFGGQDEWLRAPHTLISLGRLADRKLITEQERIELSAAYAFLRIVEHRLQMEHGLQTHTVSDEPSRRTLLARRMNFTGGSALEDFDNALAMHTSSVAAAYARIFGGRHGENETDTFPESIHVNVGTRLDEPPDAELAKVHAAAVVFAKSMTSGSDAAHIERLAHELSESASRSLNPRRAMKLVSLIASSLDKPDTSVEISRARLESLVRLCGTSDYFGEMIAGHPSLIGGITEADIDAADYRVLLREAVERNTGFGATFSALRQVWARLLVQIGTLDASNAISIKEANRRQTQLAEASLDAGYTVARRVLERRCGQLNPDARFAVLGIGRLGGSGMDYGSDLDVVLIYDDKNPSLVPGLDHPDAYARLSELLVASLSSLTREGYLYRVDLRMRPDGKSGSTCIGSRAFINYLAERSAPWEWLAYVKLRAVAGDVAFGRNVEENARQIIHDRAQSTDQKTLRAETRRIRDRLEHERSAQRRGTGLDIKYGRGGMLDVYFATRYLQLRDNVPNASEDRSTMNTLEILRDSGSLSQADFVAMSEGYGMLRKLDHSLRLIVGRSTRLPATENPALADIARRMEYESVEALTTDLSEHLANIRAAYDRITLGVRGLD
jgi:glutamate-ammonia-ligase adenylyltransferase